MVAIRNNDPGVVGHDRDHDRFGTDQRIDLAAIDDRFYFQETEQYLILSLQYNMIRGSNNLLFNCCKWYRHHCPC